MARVDQGRTSPRWWRWWPGWSYKRTTIVVCSINLIAAIYVLRSLYSSFYFFSSGVHGASHNPFSVKYRDDQIKAIEESIRARKVAEPIDLIRLVKEMEDETVREKLDLELSQSVKQMVTKEILHRLKGLEAGANVTEQREALELWRIEKLEEVKQWSIANVTSNSTMSSDEAMILERTLRSAWSSLLEDIGLWMPEEINNEEHDDGSQHELEEEIIPGRPLPPECHAEPHTDYNGAAVRWGLTHHKESAADCCQACLDQAKRAKSRDMQCNIWVYCPYETGCYSPDIYEHKHQECWLKQADTPKLNFKDRYSESYRESHPTAPVIVPWISGVVGS